MGTGWLPVLTARPVLAGLLALAACAPAASPSEPDAGVREVVDAGAAPDAGIREHPLCVDGQSVDGVYPLADYRFETRGTLPDLAFTTGAPDGGSGTASLHDYFEPCARPPRLLVIRIGAAWCATCRWSVDHTAQLVPDGLADRLEWLDLLVADEDNRPADLPALARWTAAHAPPGAAGIDPGFAFAPLDDAHLPLPYVVVVDTSTMRVRYHEGNPAPQVLANRLASELAELDGKPDPADVPATTFDGRFTTQQWDLLHEMTLPGAPPPDPTNAVADDSRAAELGRALFSDARLSPGGNVSCATCHDPAKHFTDERPTSVALATGDRNAPSVLFAAHARWQFWDGRADTLWMQATGPFENEKEFGSSRLFVAHRLAEDHAADYQALFGPLPDLADAARFPPAGRPGDPAWEAMSAGDRELVTRVYVNVAKAIAAYERTLRARPNRLDAYLGGQLDALTDAEKEGAHLFFTAGCIECHSGPRLTDDAFHVVRFPTGRQDGAADRGRIDVVAALLASPLNAAGAFSDAPPAAHGLAGLVATPGMLGAMKTPPLRGVANTGPWGHGGTFPRLRDVVEHYSKRGLPSDDPRAAGESEPWLSRFSPGHIDQIVPFLQVLEAEPAP